MSNASELLKEYKSKVSSFNEDEIGDVSLFFSEFYGKKYINSREEAFDILINDGLPRALGKLDSNKKQEYKKKILSL